MRSLTNSLTAWLIPLVAAMAAAPCAEAAVAISNKPTSNMSCSGGVCVSTAKKAVLNVTDLEGMLASGAVKVVAKAKASDIKIVHALSWPSAHRLTLRAFGSIAVQQPVTVTGPGGLTLVTNSGGGTGGALTFSGKGHVVFWDLSSSLIINGTNFALVGDIQSLAADIAANRTGAYALANNYDASVDGTYGTVPIPTVFNDTFEGLGNTISNLTINDSTDASVGLFFLLGQGSAARDINILNATITASDPDGANAGVLAFAAEGTVSHVTVAGSIAAPNRKSGAGGLTAVSASATSIDNCHAAVAITVGDYSVAGGLVAEGAGTISHSDASSSVSGGFLSRVGGLVGFADGSILNSHATGDVSAGQAGWAGGLAAQSSWVLSRSYATGKVSVANIGEGEAGGLVAVVVSSNSQLLTESYATGDVEGTHGGYVGGLVSIAYNGTTITKSYARGSATLPTYRGWVGGLIGWENQATVSQVYSIGAVSGGAAAFVGGLVGEDSSPGSFSFGYWDLNTSGISNPSQGAGNIANDPGITGLTDAQLKSGLPAGFDPAVWGQSPAINNGYPYLLAVPPG
ncbi:MAG TPA: GLUG motif-containing protein [Rhizomicrobium sp.]